MYRKSHDSQFSQNTRREANKKQFGQNVREQYSFYETSMDLAFPLKLGPDTRRNIGKTETWVQRRETGGQNYGK